MERDFSSSSSTTFPLHSPRALGGFRPLGVQLLAAVAITAWSAFATYVLLKVRRANHLYGGKTVTRLD